MNIPQSHVIYLRYNWHVASHDSLTLVYMLKLTILMLKIIYFDKTHENVKYIMPEHC